MPETKGSRRYWFCVLYHDKKRNPSICQCGLASDKHINDSNTISSGNKSVQESNLSIVFKFNSEGNFGIGGVKSIVKEVTASFLMITKLSST